MASEARRRVIVPAVVGAVALVLAGVFAGLYVAGRDGSAGAPAGATASGSVDEPETRRFVSRRGGFTLRVPTDLEVHRHGAAAQFVSADRDLVVAVAPVAGRTLGASSRVIVRTLRGGGYRQFEVLHRTSDVAEGREVRTTYGRAVNDAGTPVRFVAVVLEGPRGNYAISAFTPRQSDPSVVLPRLHAMVNSFRPTST